MVATINLPGSKHFDWRRGTRAECEAWLESEKVKHQEDHGGVWTGTYLPATVHAEKAVRSWKYRDGTRVIDFEDVEHWL